MVNAGQSYSQERLAQASALGLGFEEGHRGPQQEQCKCVIKVRARCGP